jgi:hypothetical protein
MGMSDTFGREITGEYKDTAFLILGPAITPKKLDLLNLEIAPSFKDNSIRV